MDKVADGESNDENRSTEESHPKKEEGSHPEKEEGSHTEA
jgi:hypothetical protein